MRRRTSRHVMGRHNAVKAYKRRCGPPNPGREPGEGQRPILMCTKYAATRSQYHWGEKEGSTLSLLQVIQALSGREMNVQVA